jgi:hypothetical protein
LLFPWGKDLDTEETRYRDELNFAEFPLASLSSRAAGQPYLTFSDTIFDQGRNQHVTRKLTISPSAKHGLPTPMDDEVILGLIQLTSQQRFASRNVSFTRYQLLQLLGWRVESKSYERLKDSLFRWLGVTLQYEKAWWSKADQCWVDKGFHLLDDVQLLDRKPSAGEGASSFTWNETVFRSFQSGYLKQIDFDFYRSLESAVAKRMYRFLDKKFHLRGALEFSLTGFACDHLGLGRRYHNGEIKRLLQGPIDELTSKGFLEEGRFVKTGKGEWKVCFRRVDGQPVVAEVAAPEPVLVGKLTAFGITRASAVALAAKHPEERVLRQLEFASWLQRQSNAGGVKNLPGYLVKAIQEDFAPPVGFAQKVKKLSARKAASPAFTPPPESPERLRERQELDALWKGMEPDEQHRFEQEALASAEGFLLKQYRSAGSGSLFQTVRRRILDDHLRRSGLAGPSVANG